MTTPDILNQFAFPVEAAEDFARLGMTQRRINHSQTGTVSEFNLSGHDRGLGYRFFILAEKNLMKSEAADMEINDEVEMVEWYKSKKEKPVERVRFLPQQLLKFNKAGEVTGGLYKENYLRWKQGLGTEGLPLARWERATVGQVKTLESEGIFTVQQLAATDRQRVEGRFPKELVKLFHDAVHFVNAQAPMENIKGHTEEVLSLKQENSKLKDALTTLTEKVEQLANGKSAPKAKQRGRPKKVSVEDFDLEPEAA